jgi:Glycosyl transferase family group 2
MGHNAYVVFTHLPPDFEYFTRFMRWRAIQDASIVDAADGQEKIWSESNVSEDFDMALRLMMKGYIIRLVDF